MRNGNWLRILFPEFSRELLLLIGTGTALAAVLFAQRALLNPFDFQAARGPLSESALAWANYLAHTLFPALLAGCLAWYFILLPRLDRIPPRTLRAWLLLFFVLFAAISIGTLPTKSQDAYWSLLLAKGWVGTHLNPYLTAPDMLRGDAWFAPYLNHTNEPMTYGPLWVFLVGGAVFAGRTLMGSLLLVKLASFASLLLGGWLLSRIMDLHNFSLETKNRVLLLTAWNPVVLQLLLMDAHNDFLILLSVLASYFLFKKERYAQSSLILILGGLVKYAPLFLLPIPLFYLVFQNNIPRRVKIFKVLGVALAGAALAYVAYLPFGGMHTALQGGPAEEILARGDVETSLFPTMMLGTGFGLGVPAIRLAGVFLGLLVMAWHIHRRRPLLAYTHPLLAVFLFGTPWFLPWYALWILPLFMLFAPLAASLAVSAFLILIPSPLSPLEASYLLVLFFLAGKLFFPGSFAGDPKVQTAPQ